MHEIRNSTDAKSRIWRNCQQLFNPRFGFISRQLALHRHTRYSEQLYVLEGEFTIWTGEKKVVLTTGENVLIPIGIPHVVAASGDKPACGLMIAAPSAFAELIAAVGTQNKTETPNMELFNRISAEIGDEFFFS